MSRIGGGWLPSVWGSFCASVSLVGIHSPCFTCRGPICGVGDYVLRPHMWCGRLGCLCCPACSGELSPRVHGGDWEVSLVVTMQSYTHSVLWCRMCVRVHLGP